MEAGSVPLSNAGCLKFDRDLMSRQPESTTQRARFEGFSIWAFAVIPLVIVLSAVQGLLTSRYLPVAVLAAVLGPILAWSVHRLNAIGVRVALLFSVLLTAALVPQAVLWTAQVAAAGDWWFFAALFWLFFFSLGVAAVGMLASTWRGLRRLPPSLTSWAVALLTFIALLAAFFVVWNQSARWEAPESLHGTEVRQLQFSEDGSEIIVSSDYSRDAHVFDASSGQFSRVLKNLAVRAKANPDVTYNSPDQSMTLAITFAKGRQVDAITLRRGTQDLWSKRVTLWDRIERGTSCCTIRAAAFSPDNRLVAVAYFGSVYVYETATGTRRAALHGPAKRTSSAFWWWEVLR
jgi:hypothetical protein